jgi:two-component system chemotaxis sensor kinase CheA
VATQRVLLVTVAQQLLAFPTEAVERLLRVRFEDIRHAEGRTVVTTRDGPVPLVALARLLPPLVERPAGSVTPAVLLHADGRRLAVAVDEFATEDEVIVQPFDDAATPLPLVNGAALLPSGRVAILLDTGALIAAALQHGGPGVARGQGTEEARHQPTILVVDDSITTRTLEQVMLEAAGYRVLTAVDGADGWRVLQERGVDVVVADVEMPRMDGFALCEAIRASRRLRTTPVVLVTALESAEHRARGMDAGADAYIGKTGFDQQNLLTTIKQLIGRGTE